MKSVYHLGLYLIFLKMKIYFAPKVFDEMPCVVMDVNKCYLTLFYGFWKFTMSI